MLKFTKDCLNLHRSFFLKFFDHSESKSKILVVSETLKIFVNILSPDDKYSVSVKASD